MTKLFVTSYASERELAGITCVNPEGMMSYEGPVDTMVVEPTFYSFDGAGNSELGFPFMAMNKARALAVEKLVLTFTYTGENARKFKGYIADVEQAMKTDYPHVKVHTVPFVSCGAPVSGTVLMVVGSLQSIAAPARSTPMMPATYFPGMISHVLRNRANYTGTVGGKQIGAVRSDRALLPTLSLWGGKSLMVEYRKGNTSELKRMDNVDVGRLFGIKPRQFTDDLYLCLPADVVQGLASLANQA